MLSGPLRRYELREINHVSIGKITARNACLITHRQRKRLGEAGGAKAPHFLKRGVGALTPYFLDRKWQATLQEP